MRKIYFLIILLIGFISSNCYSQIGKKFWFVAPDVIADNGDDPIIFRITTFDSSANVKISMPANGDKTLKQFTVSANSQFSVEVNKQDVENAPANSINNKGIYISSDADIAAYYEVSNPNNSEKFILKAENALGKQFFIPSQNIYNNLDEFNGDANEKADIVATEDNTTITIIPATDVTGHAANVPYTIVLNKGQTYCIECRDISNSGALAGTEVTADKQIAITISDDAVVEDADSHPNDLIGDQLIPVIATGTEYVAINTSKSPDSYKNTNSVQKVFVMAIEDNTLVFLNNTTKNTRALMKGEIAEFDIADHALFIYATKRVYAYQLTGLVNTTTSSANELGSAILPSYSCNGSNSVSFTRVFNRDFWVNIVVKRKDNKSFTLYDNEGNVLNLKKYINSWQTVPGQDTGPESWVCCAVNMNDLTTGTPYILKNSTGVFHLCVLDENGSNNEASGCASFGYFSSYNSFWIDGPAQACKGNYVELSSKDGMKSYTWYSDASGNNILGTGTTLQVTESGVYYVDAEARMGGCTFNDSIIVDFRIPLVDLGNDTTVCHGEELHYALTPGYTQYNWSNGDRDNETSLLANNLGEMSLNVEVTDDFGCSNTDTVKVEVVGIPAITLDKTSVCRGESVVNTTSFDRYEWVFNGVILNTDPQQNFITPQQSGTYTLTAWNAQGCSATEAINLTVNELPVINMADVTACEGTTSTVNAPAGYSSYLWSTGATTQSVNLNSSNGLWLEVTDANSCVAREDVSVTFIKPATLDLGSDKEECVGVDILISGDASFTNYSWTYESAASPGTIIPISPAPGNSFAINNAAISNNGIYRVEAQDVNGCAVSDEIEVILYTANPPVLSITENLCDGEMVDIIATEGYDSYTWFQDGSEIVASKDLSQLADVGVAGVYRVNATMGTCIKSSEISVVSHTLPQVKLPDDFSLCEGSTGELKVESFTASSGAIFDYLYWNTDESTRLSNYNTAVYPVSTSGEYTVTAVDSYGCKATDQITIATITPESFDLGRPVSFCSSQSITIENPVAAAQNYQWYKINNGAETHLLDDAALQVINAGTYVLKITDANGCKSQDDLVISENPLPNVTITGEPVACGSTTLTAQSGNSGLTYQWNSLAGMNDRVLNVDKTGNYSVQVWDSNGCTAIDDIDVVINTAPTISLADITACEGENVLVTAPAGYAKYNWSTGQNTQNISVNSISSLSLQVEDANGCKAKDEMTISYLKPVGINLGPDRNDCAGISITLDAGSNHSSWKWSFTPDNTAASTSVISNASSYQLINALPSNNGTYQVEAVDVNGCAAKDEVKLAFYSADPPLLSATENLCDGKEINISASSGYDTYKWYLNGVEQPAYANSESISNISKAGSYRVEASMGACIKYNDMDVVKHALPTVKLPSVLYTCRGVDTYITVEEFNGNGATLDYLFWNNNQDKRYGDWQTASLFVNTEGKFSVTAIDEFGCETSDTTSVFATPEPELLLASATICKNDILELGVSDDYSSYIWSNGGRSNQTQFITSTAGDYKLGLSVTDTKGCIFSDTVDVHVDEVPEVTMNDTEVCAGGNVVEMSDFVKYEWVYDGGTINTVENQNWIIPYTSGVYTVTGFTAEGCNVTKDVNITVHPLPQITLENKIACEGKVVTIAGPSGFSSYLWSTGDATQDITLSVATDYWVEVTDASGCKGTADASLSYIKSMPFDLGEDVNECVGVEVTLTANSSYTNYNWSFEPASHPGALVSLNTVNNYTYQINNAATSNNGIYHVQAKDVNGCPVSDAVLMTFYSPNPPNLNASQTLCTGGSVDIVASKGYNNYTWYDTGGIHIPSNDGMTTLSDVKIPGTYKVVATIGTCTLSKEIAVQERQIPQISLLGNFKLCNGEEGVITVDNYQSAEGAALDYLYWNTDNTHLYTDWNTAELVIDEAKQYSVTAVDVNGCIATSNIVIESAALENLNLGDPLRMCESMSQYLKNPLSSSVSYQWFKVNADADDLLLVNDSLQVTEPGIYKLQTTDANGCVLEDEVAVNVNALPDISLTGEPEACVSTELVIAQIKEGYRYQWNGVDLIDTDIIKVNTSGTYQFNVWDANGCSNSTSIDVVIHQLPLLALQNDTVCSGEKGILSGPSGSGFEYLWSTGSKSSSISVDEGDYSLWFKDENGCTANSNAKVVWRQVPKVDLGKDVIICPLEDWTLDAGSGFASYRWHNGQTTPDIIADLLDTVNIVTVTDKYGCSGFDSQTVKLKVAPEMDICSDTSVCSSEVFVLDVGYGFISYLWNDGTTDPQKNVELPGEYSVEVSDGCYVFRDTAVISHFEEPVVALLDTSFYAQVIVFAQGGTEPYSYSLDNLSPQEENTFKNLKNGTHDIQVIDFNGCVALANLELNSVLDIEVPDYFTPNDDGRNDTWDILGITKYPDTIIKIYDRYGKLLIKYFASDPGWDGRYLGKPVPTDDYWYVIDLVNAQKLLKGHLTLKR